MRASVTRARCKGVIIGCETCKEVFNSNGGFCPDCGRPANRKVGDTCGYVFAYVERGAIWNGKIKLKCRYCKTINII